MRFMLCYGLRLVVATSLLLTAARMTEAAASACGSLQEPRLYRDENIQQPAPVIFGEKYPVPAMRIRFIDGATQLPLQVKSIAVNYGWKWLRYPYPEHAWGVWEDAADLLSCLPDKEGWIDVPMHEVRPRGWYDGKYTRWPWSKRPHFESVEVVAFTGYFARTRLRPVDLQKFSDHDLVITVFDGWRTQSAWQTKGNN